MAYCKSMTVQDDNGPIKAPVVRIVLGFTGPAAHHNLICWLCQSNFAVYDMRPNWVFRPCWECQKQIFPKKKWWQFWRTPKWNP